MMIQTGRVKQLLTCMQVAKAPRSSSPKWAGTWLRTVLSSTAPSGIHCCEWLLDLAGLKSVDGASTGSRAAVNYMDMFTMATTRWEHMLLKESVQSQLLRISPASAQRQSTCDLVLKH